MAGGRPSKPLALVKGHRTKAEKEVRQKAENELLTGISLKEWPEVKRDPISHKEFSRVKKLLKSIGKDDDLYGAAINTHCKIKSEEHQMYIAKDKFIRSLDEIEATWADGSDDMTFIEYMKVKSSIQGQICYCDKAIMQKRKLMLDISKENIMTIASALRSIPKKPDDKPKNAMAAYLAQRQAGNNGS